MTIAKITVELNTDNGDYTIRMEGFGSPVPNEGYLMMAATVFERTAKQFMDGIKPAGVRLQ